MLSELKIVTALNNEKYYNQLRTTFDDMGFDIYDAECNVIGIEIAVLQYNADVLIISADDIDFDSIYLLVKHLENHPKTPYIIVLYTYDSNDVDKLSELNVNRIKMPVSFDLLCNHIRYVHSTTRISLESVHAEIKERIHEILVLFNASTRLFGYDYLREALFIASCTDKKLKFSRDVYPLIAQRHDTTTACVERAIRVSISDMWNKSSVHIKNIFFDSDSLKNNEKPTNNEFVTVIGKYVYNEYEKFLIRSIKEPADISI